MKQQDLIILHGWNLSGKRFDPLARELKKLGYRIFAPDFPGFGGEPSPAEAWHVADYARFLSMYIAKHGIKKPVLVGHSFGGRVALKFAELFPGVAEKLVLTGTPGFSPIPSKKLRFFLIISKIGGLVFLLPGLRKLADSARKWLYYVAGAREFLRAEGSMRQTFKYIVSDDLVSAMDAINIPCLLVWGERDTIVPVAIARRMATQISGAALVVIPGTDHGVPFRQAKQFAAAITRFLRS